MTENGISANATYISFSKTVPDFDRIHLTYQFIKRFVEKEYWTIEYYSSTPNLVVIRPPEEKMQTSVKTSEERTMSRLSCRKDKEHIWGCKLCDRFFYHPTMLLDDLASNHDIKHDEIDYDEHVLKLRIRDPKLFTTVGPSLKEFRGQ